MSYESVRILPWQQYTVGVRFDTGGRAICGAVGPSGRGMAVVLARLCRELLVGSNRLLCCGRRRGET
jgi:hypothetical protein